MMYGDNMNEWLDKGLFCVAWVSFMWIADKLLSNTGVMSYGSLMIGALSITAVGLIKQYRASVVKR